MAMIKINEKSNLVNLLYYIIILLCTILIYMYHIIYINVRLEMYVKHDLFHDSLNLISYFHIIINKRNFKDRNVQNVRIRL